jgi:hypothetical protein
MTNIDLSTMDEAAKRELLKSLKMDLEPKVRATDDEVMVIVTACRNLAKERKTRVSDVFTAVAIALRQRPKLGEGFAEAIDAGQAPEAPTKKK